MPSGPGTGAHNKGNAMKKYSGTKIIAAMPMTLGAYNVYRSWAMPEGENPDTPGYLVEYTDGGVANDPRHDGYISWSPEHVFNNSYIPVESFGFGVALTALKVGCKVARKGWNGKGMWLILVPGTADIVLRAGTPYGDALPELLGCDILPHIDMWTVNADGRRAMLPGWLASQTDMLANDWVLVENSK